MLKVRIESAGILKGISFSVERGKVLGIAGKNGSGKTTLLKFVSTVLKGRGDVWWGGVSLFSLSSVERMRIVNALPQSFDPYLYYSVYEVIDGSSPFSLERKRIDEALEVVGLGGGRFGRRIFADLSGGEKVRVLIARLLAINPEVFLFDEPSAFLDPNLVVLLAGIVNDLKGKGKCILVASHDVQFLAEVSDSILGIKNGRRVFEGDVSSFLERAETVYDVSLKTLRCGGELFIKPNYKIGRFK